METNILFNFLIWIILTVLLMFRVTLSTVARMFLLIILVAHVFFWWTELQTAFYTVMQLQIKDFLPLLLSSTEMAVLSLNWIWPLSLAYIFYLSSDEDSAVIVVFLTIITTVIWALYYFSLFYQP